MTNRDWTKDDAEVLAEFAGVEIEKLLSSEDEIHVIRPDDSGLSHKWWPWSKYARQWQIQALLNMVREKGKTSLFLVHLRKELDQWGLREDKSMHEVSDHNDMELVSVRPEAICSAVLEIIPEGSGDNERD